MTLHWTIIKEYSRKLVELKECKICSSLVTNIDLFEHFNNCYNNKIKILFKNFDNEISRIKLFYNNKIKLLKNEINLSDLCEKCEFFSNHLLEIEELKTR